MKNNIRLIIEALGIVAFLILAFILYLRLMTKVQVENGPYEPQRPIVLSDTTGTWPEPDSVFTYDGGLCEGRTYKHSTL